MRYSPFQAVFHVLAMLSDRETLIEAGKKVP